MAISELSVWRVFVKRYRLTEKQEDLFKRYLHALHNWDEFGNITAITDERSIIELHFEDSLALTKFIDVAACVGLADIGSGGGFPGIPLKILFPQLPLYLIEVKRKKIAFLEKLITELALDQVSIVPLDWRTFLRKTELPIELFCARASLLMSELIRMFKPSCSYNQKRLVYWASGDWQSPRQAKCFIVHDWRYVVGGRTRRLVLLQKNAQEVGR